MKLKIIKAFVDKETGAFYKVGSEIDVSEKRGKEILANPLELAEQVKTKKVDSDEE